MSVRSIVNGGRYFRFIIIFILFSSLLLPSQTDRKIYDGINFEESSRLEEYEEYKEIIEELKSLEEKERIAEEDSIKEIRAESLEVSDTTTELSTLEKMFQKRYLITDIELRQFGYEVFDNKSPHISRFSPVADEYIIGPGDRLIIELSGLINRRWNKTVERDGRIVLPKTGPIDLWGRSYKEAKNIIRDKVRESYTNIKINITLEELRSVNVYVLGEVNKPGLYNVNPISDPLSALIKAGGIKKTGSLRKLKYLSSKGNKISLDLYKILTEGEIIPRIKLESGDIIYVPPIGEVVGVVGAVIRPAIYEIKKPERLRSVIDMAGNILPTGGIYRVQVERVYEGKRKIIEDFTFKDRTEFNEETSSIKIKNGDLIRIFEIPHYVHDYVEIEGSIEKEGIYAWEEGMKILDLIEIAGGTLQKTYLKRADILRYRGVDEPEIIEVNLKKLLEGDPEENIKLNEWDKVKIYSRSEVSKPYYVRIEGEVINPGEYPLNPNMKLNDLLFLGIPKRSSSSEAQLFRVKESGKVERKRIMLTDSSQLDLNLEPDDHLIIKKKEAYPEIGYVQLTGEFKNPGKYPIKEGETLNDIIKVVGGFTEESYPEAAVFTKEVIAKEQKIELQKMIREAKMEILAEQRRLIHTELTEKGREERLKEFKRLLLKLEEYPNLENPGRVVIDLTDSTQTNIPLGDGDSLHVPKRPSIVKIIGSVYNPIGVRYRADYSLNDYIERAGGTKPTADVKNIYIRRASGEVNKKNRKIKPGDTIIIPEEVKTGKSIWEILSLSATIIYQVAMGILAVNSIIK